MKTKSTSATAGVKRGHLLLADDAFMVAGGFAMVADPLSSEARCGCPSGEEWCEHGFSAYSTSERWRVLKREGHRTPVLDVMLSGEVVSDVHLAGRHQDVTGVRFFPACSSCGAEGDLVLAAWEADGFEHSGEDLREVRPTCQGCLGARRSWSGVELASSTGIEVGWLSRAYASWVRTQESLVDRRGLKCVCDVLTEVSQDAGAAWYFHTLWGCAHKLDELTRIAHCRACGVPWHLRRRSYPVYARRADVGWGDEAAGPSS
jgi:hypothetical protein